MAFILNLIPVQCYYVSIASSLLESRHTITYGRGADVVHNRLLAGCGPGGLCRLRISAWAFATRAEMATLRNRPIIVKALTASLQ